MSIPSEDDVVRDIMARGAAKKAMAEIPEDILPFDFEILAFESVMEALNSKLGTSADLEAFRKEIIERFAQINWVVQVEVHSTNVDGTYTFDPILVRRISPIDPSKEQDFERRMWEVRNDILGIAPEFDKGQTIPFHPDMLHDPSFAQNN